ncbi:MAG: glycoside hydrolase family 127 protein [Lentisphaeria bacterium]|nr:glycoside hydrolase family 127 protein [Lentisphaeria bacterium]NQZ68128.1 glycoside hydrolase family 127 protein [Lentisphaeria bacterium]
MKKATCERAAKTQMQIDGFVGDYISGITEQWLMIAPKANPGMLEMFRDRDNNPQRNQVPWAGEFAGKYLTSAVEILRITGDPELKKWIKEFVAMLISFQDADGYLGPWSKTHRLTNTSASSHFIWDEGDGPYYTWDTWGHYHIMLGLMLWHDETRNADALACAEGIANLICSKYLGKKKPLLVETESTEMNMAPVHSLSILYRKTKNERYLKMAVQLVDEFSAKNNKGEFLTGDYLQHPLSGKEFFESPKPRWESLHPIMGLVELYYITGEESYKEAFEKTWWSIVKLDRHNNGGFSSGEKATGNPYHLAAIESCCTIAWMAMSVEMLKLGGESIVADELELSMINSIVGMHSPTGRWATYNTPMNGVRHASAHSIVFQCREGTPELNCCSVNTPRGFGMLSAWALMKDTEGLLLNYYGPSTLTAKIKGVTVSLEQETTYPLNGQINLKVKPSKATNFALKLRIPYWSKKTRVTLNGEKVTGVKSGSYLCIDRKWKKGDRISITLDMSLHGWRGENECKGKSSLYRGPILLTYDHRYNPEHAKKGKDLVRKENDQGASDHLAIPTIDAKTLKGKPVHWDDWHAPQLLLEFKVPGGKTIRLCDFASAGETGTPYVTWLPVKNAPKAIPFSKENPLRSSRL